MKARMVGTLVMLVALAFLQVRLAQASVAPILAVDSFFTALDAGDHQAVVDMFADDAVATLVRGETYRGPDEMLRLVQLMEHPRRHHEIVQATLVGDTVTMVVEVSDHGIRWGEDTIVVEVRDGKLHSYREKAFQLRLGS